MTPIEQLKSAGFSDDEIGAWSTQQRDTLKQAGFDDGEVDTYLAGPKEPVPEAFISRLTKGIQLNGLFDEIGKAESETFKQGVMAPAISPETEKELRDVGIFSDPENGRGGPIRAFNEALIRPTAAAAQVVMSAISAGVSGVGAAVKGMSSRLGASETTAESARREAENFINFSMNNEMASLGRAKLTRPEVSPMGEVHDLPISGLPKPEEFMNAAKEIAGTDVPHPRITEALRQTWREEGIHPAEVAHDAKSDPTIAQDLLSTKPEVPTAYRAEGKARAEEPIAEAEAIDAAAPDEVAGALDEAAAPGDTAPASDIPNALDAALDENFFIPKPGSPSVGMTIVTPARRLTADEQAIISHIDVGGVRKRAATTLGQLYTSVFDRLHPIPQLDAAGNQLPTSRNPYQLMRLLSGNAARAQGWLWHGQVDYLTGNKIGPSLAEILGPVRHDLNPFRAFITSVRALELEGKGIKTGFDMQAARTVAQTGQRQFAPVMARLIEYQNELTRYMRDAGVLTDAGYKSMTREHVTYVPFHALLDEATRQFGGGGMLPSNPLFRIEGSDRVKIDPLESIIQHTHAYIAQAERNRAANVLVDVLTQRGEAKPATATTPAENKIHYLDKGFERFAEVPRDIADAVKNIDGQAASWITKWLSSDNVLLRGLAKTATLPARTLRAGSTLSPDFVLRNIVRDYFSALLQSEKKGLYLPTDSLKGLFSEVVPDEYFRRWLQGGGGNAELVGIDRRYIQNDIRKLTAQTGLGNRAWNVVQHPLDALRTFSEYSENATRLGEFKVVFDREIARGATKDDASRTAAFASREVTVDFARRGSITQALNMIDAFWNSQVQGADRLARQVRDHPISSSLKIVGGITLPSVILWAVNHDDPRYREMPGWERDMFWNIMLDQWNDMGPAPAGQGDMAPYAQGNVSWRIKGGRFERNDGAIIRLPKPFEPGVLFGSGMERLLDAAFLDNPSRMDDFARSVFNTIIPDIGFTLLTPIIEQFSNRSLFTGQKLIPSSMEGFLPEYQQTPYTTEIAKAIGRLVGAIPGMTDYAIGTGPAAGAAKALTTPILIENYVRAWSGTGGMYLLNLADAALRKNGVLPDPEKPEDTLADIPFVKAFVVRYPSASTDSISHFHDEYAQRKQYFDTFMNQAKEGNLEAAQQIQEMGGPRMFGKFDSMVASMGNQTQAIRDVYKNPEITAKEKRQIIDSIYYGLIMTAQEGLFALKQMDQGAQ